MTETSLSPRAAALRPSPTLAIEAKAKALRAQGHDVLSLSAGEPDFDTPEHIKQAAGDAMKAGFTKYTPASGIPELKAAIVKRALALQGLLYEPKQAVVSCGAKHVIANALFALVDSGDEVLIPAPFWVSYPSMVRLAGGSPRILYPDGTVVDWDPDAARLPAPETGFKITPAALEGALTPRTKVMILNAPSNPTGCVYSGDELRALADVLKRHPNVWVISDEIYDALVYTGRARSIAHVAPELADRIIVVNGVSKTFAMTGWRIGWALGPEPVIAAIGNLQSQTTSNPTSIAQMAALAAITGPADSVATMLAAFTRRRVAITDGLNGIPGVNCALPDGAFYVFPDVRAIHGLPAVRSRLGLSGTDPHGFSAALAAHLLESARVALVPGAEFGYESHLRLSFACSDETIRKAVERIGEAIAGLAKA
jgi:aspartate aminotransferase